MSETPWPVEIRLKRDERLLEIDYDDGRRFALPAELLRVESPSAEVQGHGEGKSLVAGKRWVGIKEVQPVGNYAVRLLFDDGHDSGIYSWRYLRGLGENQAAIWADYLERLAAEGRDREL